MEREQSQGEHKNVPPSSTLNYYTVGALQSRSERVEDFWMERFCVKIW